MLCVCVCVSKALPKGTLEKTLDLWDRKNNHLVPKAADPNTQYDQRDDLYYAGMIPLNALAGRGDAAFGNMTEFLGTEEVSTGCLPIGSTCTPCDRSVGARRRWNHCITPTAMYIETNNPVFEGPMMVANGLQEMLLFGAAGGTTLRPAPSTLIKLFPAVPAAWTGAVFNGLRAEGAFVVSARLASSVVEVFTICALSARVDVEIHARLTGQVLCVDDAHGGSALTLAKSARAGDVAVVRGRLVRGQAVAVHTAADAAACNAIAGANTTQPLVGQPSAYNHYGYKPL